MRSVTLQHATDFSGFRSAARLLIAEGVGPQDVSWRISGATDSLFPDSRAANAPHEIAFTVPREFMERAQNVALHSDASRFALLYRLLWRLRREPRLLEMTMDADVVRAHALEKSVQRDIHKMHAFVRFREVPGVEPRAFVAWFEPEHHIVEAAAPFFARRFPNFAWAILTPQRSAYWDLEQLTFGPGARKSDVPADDATEPLWREYYSSIFNPARLKVASMRAHMPKKYWRNLPESSLIPQLIADSRKRTQDMIEKPATEPARQRRTAVSSEAPVFESSYAELRAQAENCRACPLWQQATQTVFGEGPEHARIMLLGEQPGDQEDIAGKPFVGPAGRLLDRALQDAGLDRAQMYVTNAVKHFKFEPRGKRRLHKTPGQLEISACHRWLAAELATLEPKLIVALGATAARSIFGRPLPVLQNRGRIFQVRNENLDYEPNVLVTVHPSSLLRLPDEEKDAAYQRFVADLKLASLAI